MNTDSSSLYFESTGPRDAPAVLFLHGGGAAGWMWREVMALLPEYYCLAPDLPEQGQSRAAGTFSMEHAADLAAGLICDHVPARQAVVAGLSEGAQVLVAMLARHPALVSSALVSSALLRPLPGATMLSPALLTWSFRTAVAPFRASDFWIRLNMKYSAGIPDSYFPLFKKEFQEMTESGFVNMMRANLTFRLPPGLENAHAPSLVVSGRREYAAMRQSAQDLAAVLPSARAFTLDLGKGSSLAKEHNWALTAPELFARALRAWIEGCALPPELVPAG